MVNSIEVDAIESYWFVVEPGCHGEVVPTREFDEVPESVSEWYGIIQSPARTDMEIRCSS